MITAQDALSFQPQKAGMNGYRAIEVDQFVEEVAQTLDFYEKKIRDLQNKINELKQNETIIQTTLINAQKLAMQITDESKAAADKLSAEVADKAAEQLAEAERQAAAIVSDATAKARKLDDETEAIVARLDKEARERAAALVTEAEAEAARISAETKTKMERENQLLDALRAEVAKFRTDVLNMYKEQVTLIRDLPDMMPEAAPVVEVAPVVEASPIVEADEPEVDAETEIEVEITISPEEEVAEEPANVDLLKLMSDMDDDERAAADAVDEVASLTDAPIEGQVTLLDLASSDDSDDDIPVIPVTKREGGFTVNFDDIDDEE